MRKRLLSLMIFCMMLLSFGCNRQSAAPAKVLGALTTAEIGLPPGAMYLADAEAYEAAYLSDELMAATYGQGELPWQLSLVEDYGIFLSTAQHPCEFAVFQCYSRSDTDLVAAMCHTRLDTLAAHYKGSQYASYTENAKVAVVGKYVLLLISSDAQHALDVARRVL